MKITKQVLARLGFKEVKVDLDSIPQHVRNSHKSFFHCQSYPFNQMNFIWKKGLKLRTNDTDYDCSSLHKLLASVYFTGINYGHKQKQDEIKKVLGIK